MGDFNERCQVFDRSNGSQKHQVAKEFNEMPNTCTMAHYKTGVPIKNIGRYIVQMLKMGNLFVVNKGFCEITKTKGVIIYFNNKL